MKNTNKKGFTIVELVIVIAVIAILAAVLIPTFASIINKANVSKDTQLIRNLNTALATATTKPATMHDALAIAAEYGYDVEKINASATQKEIVWDSVNNLFCYYDAEKGEVSYIPEYDPETDAAKSQLWVISDSTEGELAVYYIGSAEEVSISNSFDVGSSAVKVINVSNSDETKSIMINANGGTLNVGTDSAAAAGTITLYGNVDKAVVYTTDNSFHVRGTVQNLDAKSGKIVAEESGVLYLIAAEANTKIEQAGAGVVVIPVTATTETIKTTNLPAGYTVTEEGTTQPEDIADKIAANKGLLGSGTESDPFQVYDAETIQAISLFYDAGFNYFKVNLEKTNNGIIDCAGWDKVYLNGNFDGNGVKIINLSSALFETVGYNNEAAEITLKNMDVTMNVLNGRALVRNIYNGGTTTFENIQIHGYIEGQYNMGSFYNYGTANLGGSEGCDYTVNFKNCSSDVTLVCTTGNAIGGLLGHGYEGADNTLSVNIDNSAFTGKMVTSGTGYQVMGMCSHSTFVKNGETVSRYDNTYPTSELLSYEIGEDNTVDATDADKVVVYLNPQITVLDEEGNTVVNKGGLTWSFEYAVLTENLSANTKVLDAVTSAKIVNGTDHARGYVLENGVLTLYTSSNDNYAEGTFKLYVQMYDANGDLISVGSKLLYEIK